MEERRHWSMARVGHGSPSVVVAAWLYSSSLGSWYYVYCIVVAKTRANRSAAYLGRTSACMHAADPLKPKGFVLLQHASETRGERMDVRMSPGLRAERGKCACGGAGSFLFQTRSAGALANPASTHGWWLASMPAFRGCGC